MLPPETALHLFVAPLYPYSDPDDASKLQAPILELRYAAREPKGGNWDPGMRRDEVQMGVGRARNQRGSEALALHRERYQLIVGQQVQGLLLNLILAVLCVPFLL